MERVTTFIETELLENPNYRVLINTPAGVVRAFVTNEFQFTAQADYNSPFEALLGAGEQLNLGLAAISMATGGTQFQLKSLRATVATWVDSQKPSFTLPMLFVSLGGEDIRGEVGKLLRGVYPIGVDKLEAPYGYAVDASGEAVKGTISVRIGKWFYARKQILRQVDVQYSRQVLNSGLPLFANVTIVFEPYRLPNADEVLSYFRAA